MLLNRRIQIILLIAKCCCVLALIWCSRYLVITQITNIGCGSIIDFRFDMRVIILATGWTFVCISIDIGTGCSSRRDCLLFEIFWNQSIMTIFYFSESVLQSLCARRFELIILQLWILQCTTILRLVQCSVLRFLQSITWLVQLILSTHRSLKLQLITLITFI